MNFTGTKRLVVYNNGLFHKCIDYMNGESIYTNLYKIDKNQIVCKSCRTEFPGFLALPFKISKTIYSYGDFFNLCSIGDALIISQRLLYRSNSLFEHLEELDSII